MKDIIVNVHDSLGKDTKGGNDVCIVMLINRQLEFVIVFNVLVATL